MGSSSRLLLPDDLLLEIFSRLPHAASMIRCSNISKNCFSLIRQLNSHDNHGGGDYSDPSYSRPYSLLFKFERFVTRDLGLRYTTGTYDSLDTTDDIVYTSYGPTHLRNSTHYLDFIPWQLRHSRVRACGGGLLLLNYGLGFDFYISNLWTRESYPLGGVLNLIYGAWYGMARDSRGSCKVVIDTWMISLHREDNTISFSMRIFTPETGEWRPSAQVIPASAASASTRCMADAITCGQVLYFPTGQLDAAAYNDITGILFVNPFGETKIGNRQPARLVRLPVSFHRDELQSRVWLGQVRGRLRLSHSLHNDPIGVVNLRIWELTDAGDDATPWILVHHVHLVLGGVERLFVTALNPNRGDTVFVLRNNDICSYNISEDKYRKIGEIPDIQQPQHVKDQLHLFLDVYTLLH